MYIAYLISYLEFHSMSETYYGIGGVLSDIGVIDRYRPGSSNLAQRGGA